MVKSAVMFQMESSICIKVSPKKSTNNMAYNDIGHLSLLLIDNVYT